MCISTRTIKHGTNKVPVLLVPGKFKNLGPFVHDLNVAVRE